MRTVVCKEIPRDALTFGSELGSGEFGAVYEGWLRLSQSLQYSHNAGVYFNKVEEPVVESKVAIKMLRKGMV